jgi:hypothetical protein
LVCNGTFRNGTLIALWIHDREFPTGYAVDVEKGHLITYSAGFDLVNSEGEK